MRRIKAGFGRNCCIQEGRDWCTQELWEKRSVLQLSNASICNALYSIPDSLFFSFFEVIYLFRLKKNKIDIWGKTSMIISNLLDTGLSLFFNFYFIFLVKRIVKKGFTVSVLYIAELILLDKWIWDQFLFPIPYQHLIINFFIFFVFAQFNYTETKS